MIISRGRRYIFVHIPKTGGTSMAVALEDRAKADDILIGDTPKAKRRKGRLEGLQARGRLWKHSTLADIEGIVSRADMAELFVFTLVRNPWDRLVSYYHWLQGQSFDHPAVHLAKATPFDAFVLHPQTTQSLHAAPYAAYTMDGTGTDHADLCLRLEHLEEDLPPLETHLGFALALPRVNQSARERDWRSYYTDRTAEHVAQTCASDITRFGYQFDPGG